MSCPLVARAELISIDTRASVGSMTILPPEEAYRVFKSGLDLTFDLIPAEERNRITVGL